MFRMYCTCICLVGVTFVVLVTSQSTWRDRDSRICQESFTENKVLRERILKMETDNRWIQEFRGSLLPAMKTDIKSIQEFNESVWPAMETNIKWIQEFRESLLPAMETDIKRIKNYTIFRNKYDCSDLKIVVPNAANGIYTIRPFVEPTQVYCDMNTDGGGWLVFQRRQDGSENFYRNWTDYKNGFGSLDGEFWLGNDVLASITNQRSYKLRVDLEDFQGNKAYAVYSNFSIAGEGDKYRLTIGEYSGTAGDSLSYQNGKQFSTSDSDNDQYSDNCAQKYTGAWWYKDCHRSNLNGQYFHRNPSPNSKGVTWYYLKDTHEYSLKFTEMKIRPQ